MARHRLLVFGIGLAAAAAMAAPARADFKACNETVHPLGLALAHSDGLEWISEGWWTIAPHMCSIVLVGPLKARFYYLNAVDFDLGGGWTGDRFFCTTRRSFTITGRDKCEERGYDRTGFFEVDTQDAVNYTHVLSNPTAR